MAQVVRQCLLQHMALRLALPCERGILDIHGSESIWRVKGYGESVGRTLLPVALCAGCACVGLAFLLADPFLHGDFRVPQVRVRSLHDNLGGVTLAMVGSGFCLFYETKTGYAEATRGAWATCSLRWRSQNRESVRHTRVSTWCCR